MQFIAMDNSTGLLYQTSATSPTEALMNLVRELRGSPVPFIDEFTVQAVVDLPEGKVVPILQCV